jgi:hypothetical protein
MEHVLIQIDRQINVFTEKDYIRFTSELAHLLGIAPEHVRIVQVLEGSVAITVAMPRAAIDKLVDMYHTNPAALKIVSAQILRVEVLPHQSDDTSAIYDQQGQRIFGSQYNAGRDIHIHQYGPASSQPVPAPDFDPRKFVDRAREIKLFQSLLQFDTSARILVIHADRGSGKSYLMRYFHHLCTQESIPVSLVDFRQLPNLSPPLFVDEIVRDFSTPPNSVPLLKYEFARRQYLKQVQPDWSRDIGTASLARTQAPGGATGESRLRQTFDSMMIDGCVEDIQSYCDQHPAVLLLDSFERCGERLQHWIRESLVREQFLQADKVPGKLLLVVAGLETPVVEPNRRLHIVKTRSKLSPWGPTHFQQWLRVNGYPASRQQAHFYYTRFSGRSMSLLDMLSAIEIFEQRLNQ